MGFCLKQIMEDHYRFLLLSLAKGTDEFKQAAIRESLQSTEFKLRDLFGYTDADIADISNSVISAAR
jgi:hypothetical protein